MYVYFCLLFRVKFFILFRFYLHLYVHLLTCVLGFNIEGCECE